MNIDLFETDNVFALFSSCRLVEGGAYSAVYDLERGKLFRFPSSWLRTLDTLLGEQLTRDPVVLDAAEKDRQDEILTFLLDNELGHFQPRLLASSFSSPDESWQPPNDITEAVIDLSDTMPDWPLLLDKLESVGCHSLQIRSFSDLLSPDALRNILTRLAGSTISSISVIPRWNYLWEAVSWPEFFDKYLNLSWVDVHSAPLETRLSSDVVSSTGRGAVRLRTEEIRSEIACGAITKRTLNVPSSKLFRLLRSYNGCLHGKVSINKNGQICNCPSMKTTFGSDIASLSQTVASTGFRDRWHARKDDIAVCGGCEYRYVCTDCRAYLGSDDSLEKPARCSYDPVSGTWDNG